jgi:protein required for attachment to host cells
MKRACVATVDAARARLYTYQEDAEPGRELREIRDLVHAGRRMKQGEMFSESRPPMAPRGGVGPTAGGTPGGPAKDDHRDDHVAMMDAKFAKEVVGEIDKILRAPEPYGHLILIAGPKMLGELRKANSALKRPGMVVDEIASDLSNMTATQLHDHLASLDMIPGRQRLKLAR